MFETVESHVGSQMVTKSSLAAVKVVVVLEVIVVLAFGIASGQTASVNILMAVNQKNIISYDINVIFVGDSIPT